MNIIQIAGHLGADPESRFTPSGQKVTTFRIAVNTRRSGKDETSWYRVTVWGDRFDKMMPYLKKGTGIIVVGTLNKPEIYTDKEGRPQISLEVTAEMIHFSPFGKSEREGQGQEGGQYNRTGYTQPAQQQQPQQQNYAQQNYQQQPQTSAPHDDYRFDQVGGLTNSHNEEDIPF